MSCNDFWLNYHQLAGPGLPVIPLSHRTYDPFLPSAGSASQQPQPTLHLSQKKHGSDIPRPEPHIIGSQSKIPLNTDDATTGTKYYVPHSSTITYGIHDTSAPFLTVNNNSTWCVESRDPGGPRVQLHNRTEYMLSNHVLKPYPRFFMPSFYDQPETSPSIPVPSSPNVPETSISRHVNPKPEDADNCHPNPACFSRALSPYVPFPLPPIFSLDSESKIMRVPIDTISESRAPPCPPHDERCIAIDPRLLSRVPSPPAYTHTPFARGSTVPECVWPPAPPAAPPGPVESEPSPELVQDPYAKYPIMLDDSTDIPLEAVESKADELRAMAPNTQLPISFLMSFMGQPVAQTQWHCYIRDCGKRLTRKGHMLDHIRMHLGEKVYACEYCPQTFLRKADCKRHSATHNSVRAFNCNSCLKSYGRKDLLTRHVRVCHGDGESGDGRLVRTTQGRKRKGIRDSNFLNTTQCTDQTIGGPSTLLKSDSNSPTFSFDEGNKENVHPFLSGPIFNMPVDANEDAKKKKARMRL